MQSLIHFRLDGCLSGRKGRLAKPLRACARRGFESHSVRSATKATDKRGSSCPPPPTSGASEAVAQIRQVWPRLFARKGPHMPNGTLSLREPGFCRVCGGTLSRDKDGHLQYGRWLSYRDFEQILLALGASGSDVRRLWPEAIS